MTPLFEKLVRRLVYEPETLSRNRNFHTFADPEARRARRVASHLRSVRDAVRRETTRVAAEVDDDGDWQITIVDPDSGVTRTARVASDELDILREDPDVVEALGLDGQAADR